jgi:hypothetical protein
MIFGLTDDQKHKRAEEKHRRKWAAKMNRMDMRTDYIWFVWRPVQLYDGRWIFWEMVHCKLHTPRVDGVPSYYQYFETVTIPKSEYKVTE